MKIGLNVFGSLPYWATVLLPFVGAMGCYQPIAEPSESDCGEAIGSRNSAGPRATTTITLVGNLNSADSPPPTQPFSPINAVAASNFGTAVRIFDAEGNPYDTQVYFSIGSQGHWDFHEVIDGSLVGGVAGVSAVIADGTLIFGQQGQLISETQSSNFTPAGHEPAQPLRLDLGDPTANGGTGLHGMTQFGETDSIVLNNQDGLSG